MDDVGLAQFETFKPFPDVECWVIPDFAQKYLGLDPAVFLDQMRQYPKAVNSIVKWEPQWLEGHGPSQMHRGSPTPSCKLITQLHDPRNGVCKLLICNGCDVYLFCS